MSQEIINVVITSPIDEPFVEKIKAVSNRIRVDSVAHWIVAEKKGDFCNQEELNLLLQKAEVIFGWIHQFPKNMPARTNRLKWIQVLTAGVDRLPEEILKSGIRVANASGLHSSAMGEVVLEMMLMFVKDAPACMRMKQKKEWRRYRPGLLRDRTVGILGLGAVGKEIARLCKAFGMKVIGIRRSGGAASPFQDVDRIYPREQLLELHKRNGKYDRREGAAGHETDGLFDQCGAGRHRG
jgi:phosphoglycerate dehydrogenase-like enzyme